MPDPTSILAALDRQVGRRLPLWQRATPAQLFVASFAFLVLLGTTLLVLLPGLYVGPRLSLIDALFTATSAVCVTGLIVVDTATYFTPFGQAVLALLIQLGGLGILSFTTVIIVLLGRKMRLRSEQAVGPSDIIPEIDSGRLVVAIFKYTFIVELTGALLLWALWQDDLGVLGALWPAVFHAISAFCNAGFSIFTQNFIRFAGDPASTLVVAALVVVGGIGFLVLEECVLRARAERTRRLSLHSRLVLFSTGALILVGWTLFTAFEWNNALTVFTPPMRPLAALFMSVTPRTAGFNNVDYSQLSSASLFLTVILMIIGGSPGSTAGGIKTTSAAVLVALAVAKFRGREFADAFGRMIPENTIQKTVGLVVFSVVILAAAVLLLQITELRGVPYDLSQGLFLELAFEAVSAFNTVGLSLGMTDDLSSAGKGIIIALMFIGRIGPFTVVASMARADRLGPVHIRYASEDVVVG